MLKYFVICVFLVVNSSARTPKQLNLRDLIGGFGEVAVDVLKQHHQENSATSSGGLRSQNIETKQDPTLSLLGTIISNQKVQQAVGSHLEQKHPFLASESGKAATQLIGGLIANRVNLNQPGSDFQSQTITDTTTQRGIKILMLASTFLISTLIIYYHWLRQLKDRVDVRDAMQNVFHATYFPPANSLYLNH